MKPISMLYLYVSRRVEGLSVLPPLDVYGHVPGGDGAGHLGGVVWYKA